MEYFQALAHTECSCLEGLKEGENAAEWIVDFTTQADRQGRAADLAVAYAKSQLKADADGEVERQLAMASDLGERRRRVGRLYRTARLRVPGPPGSPADGYPASPRLPRPADPATKKDLAVRRATTVPTWKALKTLFMVGCRPAPPRPAGYPSACCTAGAMPARQSASRYSLRLAPWCCLPAPPRSCCSTVPSRTTAAPTSSAPAWLTSSSSLSSS